MPVTRAQRQKFLEQQRSLFKVKTNHVIRTVKEERFQIEDDCNDYKKAFMRDESVDFGILMCLTTRTKIHRIALDALKKMRNYDDDVDISRLPTLIRVHTNQLRKIGTAHADVNIKFYKSMLESIQHNLNWLRVIKM
jgi:hypothetical protein